MIDQKKCQECLTKVEEAKGRMVILNQDNSTNGGADAGFHWSFLCVQCIREWRKRGLIREGFSQDEVLDQLNEEYPIV
tara:strand:- start:306 stop:539 length:234 start_codon:yes stop_codon:yes gene_type:complete